MFGVDPIEAHDGQWFTLVRGSDANQGKYAFKHAKTGWGLVMLPGGSANLLPFDNSGFPSWTPVKIENYTFSGWWDIRDDDNLEPNSFELVQGSEWLAMKFFPLLPNIAIGTTTDSGSDSKENATSFSFLYEGLTPIKVDYQLDQSKILGSTSMVIATQTVHNNSSTQQKSIITLSGAVENSSSWNHEAGVTIGASTEFEAGVPFIGKSTVSISVEAS